MNDDNPVKLNTTDEDLNKNSEINNPDLSNITQNVDPEGQTNPNADLSQSIYPNTAPIDPISNTFQQDQHDVLQSQEKSVNASTKRKKIFLIGAVAILLITICSVFVLYLYSGKNNFSEFVNSYSLNAIVGGKNNSKSLLKTENPSYIADVNKAVKIEKNNWKQIVPGAGISCGIYSDGLAYCWGRKDAYFVNNSSASNSEIFPIDDTGLLKHKTISSLALGVGHICALTTEGKVYCWGNASSGAVGDGSEISDSPKYNRYSSKPTAVVTDGVLKDKVIKSIHAGSFYTCAIDTQDKAYCWGTNNWGQMGDGTQTSSVPVKVDLTDGLKGKTIKMLADGMLHSCAIASDNKAYCWGFGSYGELGSKINDIYSKTVAVDTKGVLNGKNILSISVKDHNTCVIASDYKVYCWGENRHGELGNNTTEFSTVPVEVDISGVLRGKKMVAVTVGSVHACAIDDEGKVYCWGGYDRDNNLIPFGDFGILGNGAKDYSFSLVPVRVDMSGALSGKRVVTITAGGAHTCAITSDNMAYCWGDNHHHQLGGGSSLPYSSTPIAVN